MSKDYVYKRRLLKLADFLERLPKNRFNFSKWVGNDWDGKPDLSCGTAACALGWATTIPSFRKLGLRLLPNVDINDLAYHYMVGLKSNSFGSPETSAKASKKVFDLSLQEHEFIFTPYSWWKNVWNDLSETATAKEVAANIRLFVSMKYKTK